MNEEKYLRRIGIEGTRPAADLASLRLLQRQHLLNVPFENLDIHWGQPITLDTAALYRKIVNRNRGGFCYELNGLFNELLRSFGFATRLLSAGVADDKGEFSPEFDHMALLVIIGEMQYIADVGFGAFTAEPLGFVPDIEQTDECGTFVIRRAADEYFEVAKQEDHGWRSEYRFKPFGHDLAEFEERCEWQQASPDSHFRKNKVCSILTVDGRKTLTDSKFIVTAGGERSERPVGSDTEFYTLLASEFGIERAHQETASATERFV